MNAKKSLAGAAPPPLGDHNLHDYWLGTPARRRDATKNGLNRKQCVCFCLAVSFFICRSRYYVVMDMPRSRSCIAGCVLYVLIFGFDGEASLADTNIVVSYGVDSHIMLHSST
ncbi:hypothetical protein BO71DRAFT_124318 [Aspergillus ellipticus CBS 707.79]|uniref:Uncharacterized protein n=1 Tax=Aspergillus ellipticus CBS 707.79 TaxID=1448320 RepID=A0A319D2Y7_9EURO|nr:hypothetical protein BO71DRAFT_124318 [Aspergillus ellipticus CBS 707.79]